MKRWVVGVAMGILLGRCAQAADAPAVKLTDVPIETISSGAFSLPQSYGRLASVVISSEVHYLYFEDGAGTVRVLLVGPRGAAQRSRNALQLLSPDVFLLKRGSGTES